MIEKEFNAAKLHAELAAAGLKISGVTSSGWISWEDDPSPEALTLAGQVKAAHTPLGPADLYQQACRSQGITMEAMLQALWEKVMLNEPAAAEQLLARMKDIESKLSAAE